MSVFIQVYLWESHPTTAFFISLGFAILVFQTFRFTYLIYAKYYSFNEDAYNSYKKEEDFGFILLLVFISFTVSILFFFSIHKTPSNTIIQNKIDSLITEKEKELSRLQDSTFSKYYVLKVNQGFTDQYSGVSFGLLGINHKYNSLIVNFNESNNEIEKLDVYVGHSWYIRRNKKIYILSIEEMNNTYDYIVVSIKEMAHPIF